MNGVRFINNSQGTNIDAVEKSLLSYNAPIILIAGGRNKGSDFSLLRETVKKTVKKIILIGEAKGQIRSALKGAARMEDAADMESAVQAAFKSAEGGDVVLLSPACASFDMFRNYQERGQAFKDAVKKIVDGSTD